MSDDGAWPSELKTRDSGPRTPPLPWGRHYEPVGPREARVLARARETLGEEIALAEEVLAVYVDLLGAAEEDDRIAWVAEEARLAFVACVVRLFDDLLATHYLTLRGLFLQSNRLWQDYLETLWLGLLFARDAAVAKRWLEGRRQEPRRARRLLEERGQLDPVSGALYALLDQRAHPRTKGGFERALTIQRQWGAWQVQYFLGGDGNGAWLRRGLLDWLYVATHGLDEIARLDLLPARAQWSARRTAAGDAVARLRRAHGAE